jgi:hypothetical protein
MAHVRCPSTQSAASQVEPTWNLRHSRADGTASARRRRFDKRAKELHAPVTQAGKCLIQAASAGAMRTASAICPSATKVMTMANQSNQGGDRASHEQHVKAGEQSHKNQDTKQAGSSGSSSGSSGQRGGSHEQHVKAGQQSHKND